MLAPLMACSTWRVSPTVASADIPSLLAWKSAWGWIRSQWPHYSPKRFWAELLSPSAVRARRAARGRSATQPYEQLAKVCISRPGRITKPTKWPSSGAGMCAGTETSRVPQSPNLLLDKTIQYGYQTWRAVLMLAVVYVVAVAVFFVAQHHADLIVPLMETSSGKPAWPVTQCTSSYPGFTRPVTPSIP